MKNALRGIRILLFAIMLNTCISIMAIFAIPIGIIGLIILFKSDPQ